MTELWALSAVDAAQKLLSCEISPSHADAARLD